MSSEEENVCEYAKTLGVFVIGLITILIGRMLSILEGWLFWYPLGLLSFPTLKYAILVLTNIKRRSKVK